MIHVNQFKKTIQRMRLVVQAHIDGIMYFLLPVLRLGFTWKMDRRNKQ